MRKTIAKFFIATFMIVISFCLINNKLSAASTKIMYLGANAGETYETAGINYHCTEKGSYVLFGTSNKLANAKKVMPTETEFEKPTLATDSNTGYVKRYICKATLTDLQPAKTYYYKVVIGNEESEIQSFKSLTSDTTKKSLMLLADIHASSETYVSQTQATIDKVLKKEFNNNLGLFVTAGDNVDRGGYEYEWKSLFNKMTSLKNYLWAPIPGNHEYYHDNQPGYISAEYFNQFFNNPLNGPECKLNSSYYFKYGNALIIMLDIVKRDDTTEEQIAWFKQVVENNPSSWIIVVSHPGAYSCGAYADDANWVNKNWRKTFEECQVDLAVSGHEHIYLRKDQAYNNEKNEDLGVTYLVSPASGMKQYPAQDKFKYQFDKILTIYNYAANVLTFSGNQLTVKLYSSEGNVVESFVIKSRRPTEIKAMTDQEILDSISYVYDKDLSKVIFSWDEGLWGNIKNIQVTCKQYSKDLWKTVITSPKQNTFGISGFYDTYDYNFTMTLTKADNTTISKEFELINVVPETPETPENQETPKEEKKGCKKKSLNLVISLASILCVFVLIFKKKH